MNTISIDGDGYRANGLRAAAASVIGARHRRDGRNGQDAAAAWVGDRAAAVVVCDGCSASASSEVGAQLGVRLVARSLASRLARGVRPSDAALWADVRAEVVHALGAIVDRIVASDGDSDGDGAGDGARVAAIRELFLFTIVAAAATDDGGAAVWLLGDGAFAFDGDVHVVGGLADNAPPYAAYDLFGEPRVDRLAIAPADWRTIVIATDGAADAAGCGAELADFAVPRFVAHPDALRRRLAQLARADERIDWDARRVARAAAALQDDGAIGVLRREAR